MNNQPTSVTDIPPQARLIRIIEGMIVPRVLRAVVEASLPEAVADGPRSVEDLAQQAGLNLDALRRTLRALASMGIFAFDGDGRVVETEMSRTLRRDVPGSARDFVLYALNEGIWEAWLRFDHVLKTGAPSFAEANGLPMFEWFDRRPEVAELFHRAMVARANQMAPLISRALDFSRFPTIVDVGGGLGIILAGILDAAPLSRGVLFDVAQAGDSARRYMKERGLKERVSVEAGDFFVTVPRGGDAYILKHVLHDWGDDDALRILRACRDAMTPEARLFVIEGVLPVGNSPHPLNWIDLHMMVALGGRERTSAEFEALFTRARLSIDRIVPLAGVDAIIEVAPAA